MNTTIRNAKNALLRKGQILHAIVGAAETGRVSRSADVEFAYAVMRRDSLLGGAISSDGEKGYEVRIDLATRRFSCTCADHGRSGGACKHVVALANRWLANVGRPEWVRLTGLEKAAKRKSKAPVAEVGVAV
jgi:hypothetical protein